ncbi:MAG TPA: hypothetical protein VHP13_07360 [Gammaproteobacteria bacterium]|jgi:hypothetical protein|nr:hypothetical protein [Gammaproteobacteria bacterium]
MSAAIRCRPRLWFLAAALALGGCALNYMDVMRQVDQDLASQKPDAALKALDKLAGGGDQALYLLNKAMVLRMTGDYAASVQVFEQAKPLMQYLEATSVSESAAAFTFTENLRAYQPPLYERLLMHVYQGLNYLQLHQPDAARVEAVQMDDLLKRLYPGAAAAPNGSDAFPRYFSGLIYENMGEYSDAMIAYRQAYKAYKAQGTSDDAIPDDLKLSLCRFAEYLGLDEELEDYKKRFDLKQWPPVNKQDEEGQLLFVFSDGMGPVKYAQSSLLPDPVNGHYYSITLPVLRRRPPGIGGATISAGGAEAGTEKVANIAADASQQMAADRPKLLAAEFARNVTRSAVANQADKNAQGLGSLISLVASAVDQADTRIWATLPDNIQLARLRLAPGTYDLTVELRGGHGGSRMLKGVTISPGQMTFASLQWTSLN